MDPALTRRLERIRRSRVPSRTGPALGSEISFQTAAIAKQYRAAGAVWAAWAGGVPPPLADLGEPVSLRRAVLTVRARDGAALYTLDRWLRSGGLESLRRCSQSPLSRVKLTV